MVPILETDYATLTFNDETNGLRLIWKTNCTSETYRFVYSSILDLIKKSKVDYYVADIRKLKMIAPSDRIWLQKKIIPKLFNSGMRKIAAIVAGDVYIQRHIAHINKSMSDMQPIKQFGNLEEAVKWCKLED